MYLVLHTSFLKPLLDDFPSRAIQRVFSKVLVISIPKTGTNLMGKLCLSFGFSHHNFSKKTATHISNNELKNMPSKHYSGLHIVAISEHFDALAHLEYNNIFMYRDPRDQIVSAAYYMKASGDRWICGGWPLKKIISHLIVDCSLWCSLPGKSPWHGELLKKVGTIKDFYDLYLGWMNFPGIYVTTFEKLVGTKGGGDDMVQYQEIQNISKHCSLFLDNADILAIQKNLFGGTGTFRHGIIGEWRTHFTEDDKAIFKQVAGQLLIDLGYEKDFNW
jgi:hypothetical protein